MEKKPKLKRVLKEWSKGNDKWRFNPNAIDGDVAISSDSSKLGNRQRTRYAPKPEKQLADLEGRVIECRGRAIVVQTDEGDCLCQTYRGTISENPDATLVVAGDEVVVKLTKPPTETECGEGLIALVKARRTKLCRSRERNANRSGELEHVIASNIDLLFVVSSIAEPPFRAGLVDRYLAYAEYERIEPILVVNKIDLAQEGELDAIRSVYAPLGYDVLAISAEKNLGLDELKAKMMNKVSVFSGHSGVGKTTLVNRLTGLNLPVGEVSEKTLKGLHTTTFAKTIEVRNDAGEKGYVIDTPGIREFGLAFIPREELRLCFREFRKFSPNCRYPSCLHVSEPDCAVLAALERGDIAPSRYESYLSIFERAIA
ncbi:MAG: ribosome small subunit-dependent GTPase A [Chloroherpetonaceae bacterium]|nr:ribosome small subunit-dependent GTPase A [Chloroherpetonaceae bacterium]MDW8438725.1 ribosome small subunit-dependent GTPase A [Chloroherpetonaceae bacterium]